MLFGKKTGLLVYLGLLSSLALLAGYVMARGQIFPFPSPGIHVPGLTISEYDAQGLILVALVLAIGGGFLLIPRMARGLDSKFVLKLLLVALGAHMLGALVRFWTGLTLFGFKDVSRYDRAAEVIGPLLRHLEFSAAAANLAVGTKFTEFYTGVVYAIIGPSIYGGFLVFGFFSFLGSYFFYQAFRVAFPDSQHRFYGILVFLYPSVVYWSNGIGKDALMALFIGLAAYGSALLIKRVQFNGLVFLILGLTGTATVRPHVTAMLVLALMVAFLLRKGSTGGKSLIIQGSILVVGMVLVWSFTQYILNFVGLENLSLEAASEYYDYRQGTTGDLDEGGSGFKAPSFTSPFFVPMSFVTVLFRPFPWEAHNLGALIQAMDGMLLMALMFWRAPILGKAILHSRSNPYVIFIMVFVTMMVIGLITIANFGTLVRERPMFLPLLMMLLASAPYAKAKNASSASLARVTD